MHSQWFSNAHTFTQQQTQPVHAYKQMATRQAQHTPGYNINIIHINITIHHLSRLVNHFVIILNIITNCHYYQHYYQQHENHCQHHLSLSTAFIIIINIIKIIVNISVIVINFSAVSIINIHHGLLI